MGYYVISLNAVVCSEENRRSRGQRDIFKASPCRFQLKNKGFQGLMVISKREQLSCQWRDAPDFGPHDQSVGPSTLLRELVSLSQPFERLFMKLIIVQQKNCLAINSPASCWRLTRLWDIQLASATELGRFELMHQRDWVLGKLSNTSCCYWSSKDLFHTTGTKKLMSVFRLAARKSLPLSRRLPLMLGCCSVSLPRSSLCLRDTK